MRLQKPRTFSLGALVLPVALGAVTAAASGATLAHRLAPIDATTVARYPSQLLPEEPFP